MTAYERLCLIISSFGGFDDFRLSWKRINVGCPARAPSGSAEPLFAIVGEARRLDGVGELFGQGSGL